jgi:hypothetical protein
MSRGRVIWNNDPECPPVDLSSTRMQKKTCMQLLAVVFVALVMFACVAPSQAQGCAQCLDTTRATPPSVQAAYRHAILLLGGFGATVFVGGGLLLTRRQP